MPCASCEEEKRRNETVTSMLLNATDLQVIQHNQTRQFTDTDWPTDKHKLLIFYPQTFTPVCQTELGAINKWVKPFADLNCQIITVCSDPAEAIKDWYEHEPLLNDLQVPTLSSYLLPARLGLVEGGRSKRASVFVMADGELVKQEHFYKVGRSFAELHRMLYGYSTESYCAEGWQSPADGFLAAS